MWVSVCVYWVILTLNFPRFSWQWLSCMFKELVLKSGERWVWVFSFFFQPVISIIMVHLLQFLDQRPDIFSCCIDAAHCCAFISTMKFLELSVYYQVSVSISQYFLIHFLWMLCFQSFMFRDNCQLSIKTPLHHPEDEPHDWLQIENVVKKEYYVAVFNICYYLKKMFF